MPRYSTILIVALLTMTGCGRNAPPAAANRTSAAPAKADTELAKQDGEKKEGGDTPSAPTTPPTDPPNTEATGAPSKEPAEAESAPAAEPEKSEPAPEPRAERVAILTPGGPLVVDARITIDGQPHTAAFDKSVQRVLNAGDTDGDGKATWKEFAANEKFLKGEMPNMQAMGDRQMKSLVERYDENRNGRIEPSEAMSWLGRDAGGSAHAFAVRSSRSYLPIPRANSQVWPLVDTDKNGRLSGDEVREAADKLLSLDANDDRVITTSELASLREQLAAAGGQRTSVNREATRYAAIHLEPDTEIDRVHYLLTDLYAPRQDLGPTSFRELPGLFKKLDANGDEWLENLELADILATEPHLELEVAFASKKGSSGAATVRIRRQAPEVKLLAQPTPDRLVLALGNTRLLVSAHDLAPRQEGEASAAQPANMYGGRPGREIRLMVHDQGDALFEDIDTNADGKLGEREIGTCAEHMLKRDANADGQLANDELPYSMVVAFLLGEAPNEQSFYVPASPPAATSGAALPRWFVHADLNGDGDVSRREFLGTPQRFGLLDSNQDGYIDADEAAGFSLPESRTQ